MLVKLRELTFCHWCLQLLVALDPLLQLFIGNWPLCWLRCAASTVTGFRETIPNRAVVAP